MKIYIAGPITGVENYKEAFSKAEEHLLSIGHSVMNPAVLPNGFEHYEYMIVCYSMIDVCDCVYFLENWERSKGACLEFEYAKSTGKSVFYQSADTKLIIAGGRE